MCATAGSTLHAQQAGSFNKPLNRHLPVPDLHFDAADQLGALKGLLDVVVRSRLQTLSHRLRGALG